jgi:hypothetical protein
MAQNLGTTSLPGGTITQNRDLPSSATMLTVPVSPISVTSVSRA